MTDKTYKAALEAAKKEWIALKAEEGHAQNKLVDVRRRLFDLHQTIAALSKLAGEKFDEEAALGITDMIRVVMQEAHGHVTTLDIERLLADRGFDTPKYANLQASIITVVRRLITQNQISEAGTIGNKTAYKWIGPKEAPDVIEEALNQLAKRK